MGCTATARDGNNERILPTKLLLVHRRRAPGNAQGTPDPSRQVNAKAVRQSQHESAGSDIQSNFFAVHRREHPVLGELLLQIVEQYWLPRCES
jgi:hypothetical protein